MGDGDDTDGYVKSTDYDLENAAATIVAGLLLFRFWMQAVRVRPPFSLGQFIFRLTDWLVLPLRRLLPALGRLDTASLVGAWLVVMVQSVMVALVMPRMPTAGFP